MASLNGRSLTGGKSPLVTPSSDYKAVVTSRTPFEKKDGSGRSATQRRA
jgi:hypothetical protein